MNNFEFTPLSIDAEKILKKILNRDLRSELNQKFLCACLGPNNGDTTFNYRQECYKLLENLNHLPYYPESVDESFVSKVLQSDSNLGDSVEIILNDSDLRSKYLICNSDIVFILITSYGPVFEFGRYSELIPNKIVILVPNDIPEDTQSMIAVKSFHEMYPNAVVKFNNLDDMLEKVKRCVYLRKKEVIREKINNGK